MENNLSITRHQVQKSLELSLGCALAEERVRKNLSLLEVSQQTRTPLYMLSRIEEGKIAYVWDCYKIAAFYGKRIRVSLE